MTHTLNLLASALASINGWCLASLLAIILLQRSVGHRSFLWRVLIFTALQGISSTIISSDIYRQKFGMIEGWVRLSASVAGFVCVLYMSKVASSVVHTLRESEEANRIRRDAENDRLMANDNLVVAFDLLYKSREKSERQLVGQLAAK